MRLIRLRMICGLAGLLLLGMVNGGLAQTYDDDSSSGGIMPSAEWHQKGVQRAQPATTQPATDTPAATNQTVKQVSYDQWQDARAAAVAEPSALVVEPRGMRRQRVVRTSGEEEAEVIDAGPVQGPTQGPTQGPVQREPLATDGVFNDHGGHIAVGNCGGDDCADNCEACDAGQPCTDAFGYECFDGRLNCWWIRDLTVLGGVQGFKGPRDDSQNGNFGFHEGLELSGPLGDPWNIGYQIGVNCEQSDLSGARSTDVQAPYRKQYFVTAGLFHRADCCGFQWGVAYDYLHDSYDVDIDLQQIRSEASFLFDNKFELGYYGAYGVSKARLTSDNIEIQPTDMFALFARRYFDNGGDGRLWGGATPYGDGLLGVDLWLPLGKSFALENAATYVVPKSGTNDINEPLPHESWGLSMSLVWYPGRCAMNQQHNPYRPLFTTADNTTFMMQRVQ